MRALKKMERERHSDKLEKLIKAAENHGNFSIYSNLAYIVQGNLTAHARRRVAQPGALVQIPEETADIMVRTKQAEGVLKELIEQAAKEEPRRKWKAVEERLPDHRAGGLIETLRAVVESEGGSLDVHLQKCQIRARINTPPPTYKRQPTIDEWYTASAGFLDIEIPRFRRFPEEVTWAGMLMHTPEEDKREICTIHNFELGARTYERVIRGNVEGIVKRTAEFLRPADRILAYNAPFDFMKMREAGEFYTGLRDSHPIKETAKDFFTRVGNYGKEVIDLYRWATIALAYLPNKKLDTVMHYLFGEKVKDVTYDEMEKIEEMLLSQQYGHQHEGQRVYKYLESDVDSMLRIYHHPRFKQCVEDCLWMAETFGSNFSRLFNHQNSINEAQEWEYFSKVGTVRQAVYPRNKILEKKEAKARGVFQRLKRNALNADITPGVHDVWQCYLPTAPYFRDIIQVEDRFTKMAQLSERIDNTNDPYQKFFLSKYEDAICRWVIHDYVDFLVAQETFVELEKEKGVPLWRLQRLAGEVTTTIKNGEDTSLKQRLRGGTLSQRQVKEILFDYDLTHAEASVALEEQTKEEGQEGINLGDYTHIVNAYARWDHKSNKLGGQFLSDGQSMEAKLGDRFYALEEWASTANIVYAQGDYVYIREDEINDAPVIPVMKHKVIVTPDKKIYYEAGGALKGLDEGDAPKANSNNYEMHYWTNTVRAILDDDAEAASKIANEALFGLQNKAAEIQDLLYHNKSMDAHGVYDARYDKKLQFWLPNQCTTRKGHFYHEKQKSKVDDLGYHYFEIGENTIHAMTFDDVHIDWGKYYERSKRRLNNMLEAAQE